MAGRVGFLYSHHLRHRREHRLGGGAVGAHDYEWKLREFDFTGIAADLARVLAHNRTAAAELGGVEFERILDYHFAELAAGGWNHIEDVGFLRRQTEQGGTGTAEHDFGPRFLQRLGFRIQALHAVVLAFE